MQSPQLSPLLSNLLMDAHVNGAITYREMTHLLSLYSEAGQRPLNDLPPSLWDAAHRLNLYAMPSPSLQLN